MDVKHYQNIIEALKQELDDLKSENVAMKRIIEKQENDYQRLRLDNLYLKGIFEAKNKKKELEKEQAQKLADFLSDF